MTFDNFTIKAQEAVREAINRASAGGQQSIEPVHLLRGVMTVGENVTNFLFGKLGVNERTLAQAVEGEIKHLPRVSGSGEPYLSREANDALQKATDTARADGDEYVGLEALLLGLLLTKSSASTMLKDAGVTEAALRQAIKELRGGAKVSSASSEDTYQALEKYARNSVSPVRVRRPSSRAWPSASCAATCPRTSRTRSSTPSTWVPSWPERSTKGSLRSG